MALSARLFYLTPDKALNNHDESKRPNKCKTNPKPHNYASCTSASSVTSDSARPRTVAPQALPSMELCLNLYKN